MHLSDVCRITSLHAATIILALVCVVGAGCSDAGGAAASRSASGERWEYARIWMHEVGGYSLDVRWLTRGQRVSVKSFEELIEELGGRPPGDEDDISPFSVLLDLVGEQGWELISHTQTAHGDWQKPEVWTFKRRR